MSTQQDTNSIFIKFSDGSELLPTNVQELRTNESGEGELVLSDGTIIGDTGKTQEELKQLVQQKLLLVNSLAGTLDSTELTTFLTTSKKSINETLKSAKALKQESSEHKKVLNEVVTSTLAEIDASTRTQIGELKDSSKEYLKDSCTLMAKEVAETVPMMVNKQVKQIQGLVNLKLEKVDRQMQKQSDTMSNITDKLNKMERQVNDTLSAIDKLLKVIG
jgi:DNA anti-recombination protein RmuC